ncbi:MAG TPA: hypothetical protein VF338_03205 [Leptolinea sp.]
MTEIQVLKQDLDISRTIMLATIIVAISSIVFSSITMAFERSHNVKSFRPFVNLYQTLTNNMLSLSIANPGLGPMLINKITLVIKGDDGKEEGKSLAEVLPSNLVYEAMFNYPGVYVLASKHQLKLFQYTENNPSNSSNIPAIKEELKHYSVSIEYQDVYEHRYQKTEEICF